MIQLATRSKVSFLLLCVASLTCACSGKEPRVSASSDASAADTQPDAGLLPVCPVDNPLCVPSEPLPVSPCGEDVIDLTPVGVNVMFAVDGSQIMAAHWQTMQKAVQQMMAVNPTLNFGAQLFWGTLNTGDQTIVNICGDVKIRHLAPGPDQASQVLSFLGPVPPGPGNDFFSLRAVADPLNYQLLNDTGLDDPAYTNYLVFVSSGDDNCFGTFFAGDEDKYLAYEKLAVELGKRNVRILPIGFDAASGQSQWSRDAGVTMKSTDYRTLNTLAQFGGTGLTEALAADTPDGLAQAVATVASAVRSCRFRIPEATRAGGIDGFRIELFVNGQQVSRDRTHQQALGWDFVGGDSGDVEVFNQACEAIQAGKPVLARPVCRPEAVCGTAAAKIEASPRAIQYLLDASGSMANCSEPGLACIFDGALSLWGVAARTISKSVVATVNDDVEFGLQYFPAEGGELGYCQTSAEPAIATGEGKEIAIIGSLLSTLPTGGTPLVEGLEQVAAAPGRLGEPGVSSALIVVSDGGNACGQLSTEQAVARLSAAASSLRARGIKVYALRFGTKGADFAAQDAQLRAIAINGGTAPMDPNAVPYLEAPDATTLNSVLDGLFDSISECRLALGGARAGVDREATNLFINGVVKPYDAQHQKQDGWGWRADDTLEMEMYGATCTEFKHSRSSSIVVEFGCPPAVVLE